MPAPEKPWMVVTIGARACSPKASGSQSRWLCTRSNSPDRASACETCSASQTRPSSSGVLGVAVRADAVESGRRHRVERGEERDVDAARDQPLGEQAGDRLPRPVVLGRRAPGDRREHGELHH